MGIAGKRQPTYKNKKKRPKKKRVVFLLGVLIVCLSILIAKIFLPQIFYEIGRGILARNDGKMAAFFFKGAYTLNPSNRKYSYHYALALSKTPFTYTTQKQLYDISLRDDDSSGELIATGFLKEFKDNVMKKVGDNYIERATNNGQVVRWNIQSFPLRYFVTSDVVVEKYFVDSVDTAFNEWRNASNGLFTFKRVMSPSEADVIVRFIDVDNSKACKTQSCEYSVGTTVPVVKNSQLDKMDVKINIKNNLGRYFLREDVETVLVHELGHALGIWGHSDSPGDIMYYSTANTFGFKSSKQISQRDIQTLRFLYMLEPDTTNKAIAYDKKEKLGYAPLFINKIGESNVENIERIRSYIFKTPNDVSLWIDLASEYGNVGEYKKSIETLEKSLNIATDPQTTSVIYYNIASNYVHLGLYDEALPYAQKALRDNDDYETRGLIALIKSDQKNYKEAEEEYKILLSEKPGDIDLTLNFVDMYLSKNAFLQARKVLKKLIENNPRAKNDPRLTPYRFLIIV